jgi:hypothetical protein
MMIIKCEGLKENFTTAFGLHPTRVILSGKNLAVTFKNFFSASHFSLNASNLNNLINCEIHDKDGLVWKFVSLEVYSETTWIWFTEK